MKFGKTRILALAAAHGATLLTVPAVLQAAQLEEIVVTARQRAEKIEDVPVTITAFTQTEIQNAGIERPQDFIALTPGVSVVHSAEAGDMQVNIRGINTGRDAETNFALVVDGVLQTNSTALNQELAGVTQIEVLKGPQGALYGRNAVAGAMIITTRKPTTEGEIDVKAGYGTDNTYNASLFAGGGLTDAVSGSISAYTRSTDGQFKNEYVGCDDCVDFFEENGISGRLLFEAAGGSMDVKARFSEMDSGAINFNAATALVDAATLLNFPPLYSDPNDHDFDFINNVLPKNEQKNINFSIKGDWEVGLGVLTAYAAYNNQDNYFLTDGTSAAFGLYALNSVCQQSFAARAADTPLDAPFNYGTPPPNLANAFLPPYSPTTCDGYQYQQRDQTDASVEVRLTSPGDQRVRWVAGAYFADIQRDQIVSQGADLDKGLKATAFVPTSGINPTDLLYDDTFNSQVYAVFGQLAFDVVENFEVALALRYDSEDREVQNNVPTCSATDTKSCRAQTPGFAFGSNPYINPAYTVTPSYATNGIPNRSKTFDQFQPKLSLNWKVTDDVALFASYGYGFRSGGFNSSGSQATIDTTYGGLCLGEGTAPVGLGPPVCGPNSVRNITNVSDQYDEEVSKAAELGFKSFFLDRRLSVNGAVFQTDVEDMQFFNFFAGPFGLLRVVTNLDEVSLQGAELDFRWQMFDAFSVFAGYSFVDGEIDEYKGRPYTKGNEIPYAPEYTGNAGAELLLPVGEKMSFLARVDASFVGETWFHPVQGEKVPNLFTFFNFGQGEFSKMKRDPYAAINVRIGLQGERWGVTAWGKNVADEDYLQEIIPAPEFGGSFIHDSPGDSYGVELNLKF